MTDRHFTPETIVQMQAPTGIPTLTGQDDVAAVLAPTLSRMRWPDGSLGIMGGDILVISSKAVARSEGRYVADPARGEQPAPLDGLSRLEVREGVALARPLDPDASARTIRVGLQARLGPRIGVVVAATFQRPGATSADGAPQVDLALGAAGLRVRDDHRGRTDQFGREAQRTVHAVADEIAGAAALLSGTLAGTPVVVIRGLGHLTQHDHGGGVLADRMQG